MEILTHDEAEVLAKARAILRELTHGFGKGQSVADRAADQVATIDGVVPVAASWRRDADMQNVGRLTAIAGTAEDAIFDLVNSLHSYLEDAEAGALIDRWHPPAIEQVDDEPDEDETPRYVPVSKPEPDGYGGFDRGPTARQEQLEEMGEDRPF